MDQQSKKFFGTVKGGHLKLEDAQAFKDHCSLFNDKQVYITVQIAYPKASKAQFGYFHGYILPTLSKTGWNENWWKQHLKENFLFCADEDGLLTTRSLKTLNTKEMNEFFEHIIWYAADPEFKIDIVLEPPGGWDEPGGD